jgi:hypothetical protein
MLVMIRSPLRVVRRLLLLAFATLSCGKPIGGSTGAPAGSAGATVPGGKDAWGTLTVASDAGAVARVDIDECWSGQMLEFRGVELFHDPDIARRLRIVEDPVAGARVVLLGVVPGRARVIVDAESCTTFHSHVESGNSTLNDIRSLHGSLELACNVAAVGTITAKVTFSDCSFDNRAQEL